MLWGNSITGWAEVWGEDTPFDTNIIKMVDLEVKSSLNERDRNVLNTITPKEKVSHDKNRSMLLSHFKTKDYLRSKTFLLLLEIMGSCKRHCTSCLMIITTCAPSIVKIRIGMLPLVVSCGTTRGHIGWYSISLFVSNRWLVGWLVGSSISVYSVCLKQIIRYVRYRHRHLKIVSNYIPIDAVVLKMRHTTPGCHGTHNHIMSF